MAITQKTSVSIALVGVIVAGIVTNVSMMFSLREAVTLVQRDVMHTNQNITEMKASLSRLGNETRSEMRDARNSMSALNDRLSAALLRISELEGQR